MCFVRLLVQLSKIQIVGSCKIQRDGYDVYENGGEDDASSIDGTGRT